MGWATPGAPARGAARRAVDEGLRLTHERRAYLVRRLAHKVPSSALALQESARQEAMQAIENVVHAPKQMLPPDPRALTLQGIGKVKRPGRRGRPRFRLIH